MHQEMKIAQIVRKNLATIGYVAKLRPFYKEQSWLLFERFLTIILQFTYLIHVADTPRLFMETIFMIFVGTILYISLVSTVIEMETIFILIDTMEHVIAERLKYPKAKALYEKTNQFAEKSSEIVDIVLVYVSAPVYLFPKAIVSLIMYYTTDAGSGAFELALPIWLPFDWKNPTGYLIAIAIQFRIILFSYRYLSNFVSLAVVFITISLSIAEDIVSDIRAICENIRLKHQVQSIHKQLSDMINFTNQKGLLRYFIQIYRITLIFLLLGSVCMICLAMLMIQIALIQSNSGSDSMMLWETIFCGFWSLSLVFISCELGQRYSNGFNEINNAFAQIDWYLLPIEIQRMLPTIMIYLQEPNDFRFFGNISTSRKQFQKVVNSGYKYFMVLRKFYQ